MPLDRTSTKNPPDSGRTSISSLPDSPGGGGRVIQSAPSGIPASIDSQITDYRLGVAGTSD